MSLPKIYSDEEAARKHLESLLWPNGPLCPHCGSLDVGTKLKGQSTRPGVYWCNGCQKPYSVTVGTVYESSHIPLHKWLYATHLLTSSKKGISAHQLMRMLGLGSYRSAWFLAHRIRLAMEPARDAGPIGGEGKTVEADEMFIGNKAGKRKHKGAGGYAHKRAILSLVERGGKVRSFPIEEANRDYIRPQMDQHLSPATRVYTDGSNTYRFMPASLHESVDHSKGEYVRYPKRLGFPAGQKWEPVHTNTVEGVFSIFRRGMVGTYQHCGEQHLHRYLAEFDFRYSNRAKLGIDDVMRAEIATKQIVGKRLMYRRTGKAEALSPAN
jgi:transposase-like protein